MTSFSNSDIRDARSSVILSFGEDLRMRQKLIIIGVVLLALCSGIPLVFLRPAPPAGNFPPSFSEAEKREIVSAARRDANREGFNALKQGKLRKAWGWVVNGRKQTVRSVGNQPGGQIHVSFGIDDPAASDGYAVWARYFMSKTNGHWVIVRLF
jgi:hypothetical protein